MNFFQAVSEAAIGGEVVTVLGEELPEVSRRLSRMLLGRLDDSMIDQVLFG